MKREKRHPTTTANSSCLKAGRLLRKFILAGCAMVLLAGSMAVAAPTPPEGSTPSGAPTPPDKSAPASAEVSSNGYTLTVQYWLKLEQTARETEKALQEIYTETAAAIPHDQARLKTFFAKKLAEKFPGSTFNGVMGSVMLPNKMLAHFNDKFMIDRIEEVGRINVNYFLKQGQFVCSNGTNSVGGIINKANPSQSVFTKVDIDSMKSEAEKILGNRTVTANSAEEAVINDAYQLLAVTNNARMDTYAGELVVSTDAQQVALGLAEKGYKQRHQGEYQVGADGAKKAKSTSKDLELPSERNSSTRLLLRFLVIGGLFLLCAVIVKLSWHFLEAGFRNLKKNSKKKRRSSHSSSSSRSSSGSQGSSQHQSSSRSHSSSRSSRSHGSSRSRSSSRPHDPDTV
jgi:hypothetical protein